MGVPGLGQDAADSKLAETMSLSFSRIQFTPDLMPMDITGTDILQELPGGKREFEFARGPVFANIVLADEINRAPPRRRRRCSRRCRSTASPSSAARIRSMRRSSCWRRRTRSSRKEPIRCPEAQLDRFMFLIGVDYPVRAEEIAIARTTTGDSLPTLEHMLDGETVLAYQHLVRRVPVPDHIYEFAVELVRRTRPREARRPAWLKPLVAWGAGPRAVQYLILGAKARAALHGSYMVRLEDVEAVAESGAAHRVMTTFTAQSEGMTSIAR